MQSYSLEHALQQIDDLKEIGLPNILEINNGYQIAYTFNSRKDCLCIYDNMGRIMNIREMKKLISYIEYSIENLNENEIVKEYIDVLEDEVKGYLKPKNTNTKDINKGGFVYLIKGDSGRYKIGCSKNPKRRCKELRLSSSEDHQLIHCFKCRDMYEKEKELHSMFDDEHSHSEWFDLTEYSILYIKGLCDEI